MKKEVIKKLKLLRDMIQNHYREFEVVEGISMYKSDILDNMIEKEKCEVVEIDKLIEWMKNDCPSWFDKLRSKQ